MGQKQNYEKCQKFTTLFQVISIGLEDMATDPD